MLSCSGGNWFVAKKGKAQNFLRNSFGAKRNGGTPAYFNCKNKK